LNTSGKLLLSNDFSPGSETRRRKILHLLTQCTITVSNSSKT
jgi:hypothetical protein